MTCTEPSSVESTDDFENRLREIVRTAARNGVDVEGAYAIEVDDESEIEIHVTRVVR